MSTSTILKIPRLGQSTEADISIDGSFDGSVSRGRGLGAQAFESGQDKVYFFIIIVAMILSK